jgi:hypothetical protein
VFHRLPLGAGPLGMGLIVNPAVDGIAAVRSQNNICHAWKTKFYKCDTQEPPFLVEYLLDDKHDNFHLCDNR